MTRSPPSVNWELMVVRWSPVFSNDGRQMVSDSVLGFRARELKILTRWSVRSEIFCRIFQSYSNTQAFVIVLAAQSSSAEKSLSFDTVLNHILVSLGILPTLVAPGAPKSRPRPRS